MEIKRQITLILDEPDQKQVVSIMSDFFKGMHARQEDEQSDRSDLAMQIFRACGGSQEDLSDDEIRKADPKPALPNDQL